jgi:hypothetical protein
MNDKVAKVCLAIVAVVAIAAAVIVSACTTATIATTLIQLAAFCVGGISGVAVQGTFSNKDVSLCQPVVSDSDDLPDVI